MSDEIKEKNIIQKSVQCLSSAKLETTYEVARDIVLDYITNLQQENDRLNEENKKFNKWIETLNKENHRLNNIRKYAIQFININQHEKTFVLDYYDLKKLRGILSDNDFYIELFKEQLKELKENNNE